MLYICEIYIYMVMRASFFITLASVANTECRNINILDRQLRRIKERTEWELDVSHSQVTWFPASYAVSLYLFPYRWVEEVTTCSSDLVNVDHESRLCFLAPSDLEPLQRQPLLHVYFQKKRDTVTLTGHGLHTVYFTLSHTGSEGRRATEVSAGGGWGA